MAQTSRARLETPPSRPEVLSRLHHMQALEHHLSRMCSYTASMKDGLDGGQLPGMDHVLQVHADSARLLWHLSALKELELARPEKAPVVAAAFRTAARRKTA